MKQKDFLVAEMADFHADLWFAFVSRCFCLCGKDCRVTQLRSGSLAKGDETISLGANTSITCSHVRSLQNFLWQQYRRYLQSLVICNWSEKIGIIIRKKFIRSKAWERRWNSGYLYRNSRGWPMFSYGVFKNLIFFVHLKYLKADWDNE